MRKVGDVRARATNHFGAVLDQAVQLRSKRRDLRREAALKTARLSFPNTRKRTAHTTQRLQSYAYLDEDSGDQADTKDCEGPEQYPVEFRDFVFDQSDISGNEERVRPRRPF